MKLLLTIVSISTCLLSLSHKEIDAASSSSTSMIPASFWEKANEIIIPFARDTYLKNIIENLPHVYHPDKNGWINLISYNESDQQSEVGLDHTLPEHKNPSNELYYCCYWWVYIAFASVVVTIMFYREVNSVYPMTGDLSEDLSRPSLPWILRVIGVILDWLPMRFWNVDDAEELLQKGAQDAGLPPNYSAEVVKSIQKLCSSIRNDNVQFHWVGRLNMHDTIISGLSHYLQVNEAHRQNPELSKIKLNDPLIVVGIPRSGTTHLHRLLALSPDSMSIPMWQHFYPAPPRKGIDTRRLSLKIQFIFWKWVANRYSVDAVHFVRPDLPDECTFSLRLAGASHLFWSTVPVYDYLEWLQNEANMKESYAVYRRALQMMQAQNPDKRFVLKCPSHAMNLDTLVEIIPEAKIVFTHRKDLHNLAASEASLISRLQAASVVEFDWWRSSRANIKKGFKYSENMVEFASKHSATSRIFHAPYSELVADPVTLVQSIHKHFGLFMTEDHGRKLDAYSKQNAQHSHGKHRYDLHLISKQEVEQGFARYTEYFAEYLEKQPDKKVVPRDLDVIIVGGGLSGLAAAQRLVTGNPALRVVVLEARERVGGRTSTVKTPEFGANCDVGGAYIGPTQDRILHVAKKHSVKNYKVFTKGRVVFHNPKSGKIEKGSIDFPPIGMFALLDFNSVLVKIEKLVRQVDVRQPSLTGHASELDKISVKEWIMQTAHSDAVRSMFPRVVDSLLCKPSSEVSMLYFIWYARNGDTLKRLMDITNGAQERKFLGGSAQISQRMAEKLGLGTVVKLDSPVSLIDQNRDTNVRVACRDGTIYTAKKVIIAMPLSLYENISWTPELPSEKLALSKKYSMGHIIKTVMYYEDAWWREKGLNAQIWDPNGPVLYSIDDCAPSNDKKCPAIMGFVLGDDAKLWGKKSRDERKSAIAHQYARLFKSDLALKHVEYVECDWNAEEFSGGGCVDIPEIGSFVNTSNNLRSRFGKVHFAGTELATKWAGYMDGAISSGERAADEVLAEMHSQVPNSLSKSIAKSARPSVIDKLLADTFDTTVKVCREHNL